MLIRKILCPTDHSENAKTGMAYAISLAREHKAQLVFFHVTQFPWCELAYPSEPNPFLVENWSSKLTMEYLFRIATGRTENFVQFNFGGEIEGVSWTTRISIGNIRREIVTAALQDDADFIVMAKRKRGIVLRLFTRSLSKAVSEKARCPVLALCPPQIRRVSSGTHIPFRGVLTGSEA